PADAVASRHRHAEAVEQHVLDGHVAAAVILAPGMRPGQRIERPARNGWPFSWATISLTRPSAMAARMTFFTMSQNI
ncbi:MAG: hypothetical protein ACRYF7_18700, partial [Janthinobacterium lividum]